MDKKFRKVPIVPVGSEICFSHISFLIAILQVADTSSSPWEKLTREFPILDDIVDRSAKAEKLCPTQMRKCLIELYKTYVREWETFEPQLSSYIKSEKECYR